MADTIKDGGPAFPARVSVNRDTGRLQPHQFGNNDFCTEGMSLRDAMALHVHLPNEYSVMWAEKLLGESQPNSRDHLACIDFWMRAEAAYRYKLADAMLRARGEQP